MAESIVTDWLSDYTSIESFEIRSFALQHEHNHEIAHALFTILNERLKYPDLLHSICNQFYSFYRSSETILRKFTLQFVPTLIYIYLNSVAQGDKKSCRSVETLLISVYNIEITNDDGQAKTVSFRMPVLAQASIYHEEKSLHASDLRRWEENSNKDVNWGPLHQVESINAQNRLKVVTALMFVYNQQLSLIPKSALSHLCRVSSQLANQGFSKMGHAHRSSYGSDPNNAIVPKPLCRIPMSSQFLLELLHAVYFAMFNDFGSIAIQSVDDIHNRACYELFPEVILVTNAIKNSLHANPSGQPSDGPMGISVALTPTTSTVTVSKSMITNASFRTKKLPGLIVGAIIRYAGTTTQVIHLSVQASDDEPKFNQSLPPDTLWLKFPAKLQPDPDHKNVTYAYTFRGQVVQMEENEMDLKATFDPEIFFNIILPPIIFYAGYSLKRKYFFRNLGAILTFAIIVTTISAFLIGVLMYGAVKLWPASLSNNFTFLDTLFFGALISPTDPLTILAIFNDLHVDVNLYALVFGESVLNDAVAIVLSGAIQNYGKHYSSTGGFELNAFFKALGNFGGIFMLSLLIGATMGCITALLTKFTRVKYFPLLESALFVLMSYSTFLIAEATELIGVVSVLFCGICQAHYTYNNLSDDSRQRTKQIFELLNFLAENFIFSYIGVSMFTFPKHHFDPWFLTAGFVCAAIGRAANIYPLSFLLNLGRKPKISMNFQHMLFFAGLRGAMSFSLAFRNTVSEARQAMLTTTSMIVIVTVICQGGASNFLLNWLKIPVGVEDENEALNYQSIRSENLENGEAEAIQPPGVPRRSHEKAVLARVWGNFDRNYMKPFLTHSRPTLLETLPNCCSPIARLLTTTEQLTQDRDNRRTDSDSDLCINGEDNHHWVDPSGNQHRNSIGRVKT